MSNKDSNKITKKKSGGQAGGSSETPTEEKQIKTETGETPQPALRLPAYSYDDLGKNLAEVKHPKEKAGPLWDPEFDAEDKDYPHPGDDGTVPPYHSHPIQTIKRPLVFVPGILGTKLYRAEKVGSATKITQVWPPLSIDPSDFSHAILPEGVGPFVAGGAPPPSGSTISVRPPVPADNLGDNPLVDQAYDQLLNALRGMGYKLGENFFIFGYNWLQSNEISGRRLAGYLAALVKAWPWPPGTAEKDKCVDLLCHSMGGHVCRAAIRLFDAPVRKTMYMVSPFYGAVKAYHVLKTGVNHGRASWGEWLAQATGLLKRDILVELNVIARSSPAVYELMPDQTYFDRAVQAFSNRGGWLLVRRTSSYSFTVPHHPKQAYVDDNISRLDNAAAAELAMAFKSKLGVSLPGPSFVVASTTEKTMDAYMFVDTSPYAQASARGGDGTVPWQSVRGPGAHVHVPGSHGNVPNDARTHYWIRRYFADQ